MQVKMLLTGNHGETIIGLSLNWLTDFAVADSQNRNVEFTRVTSRHHTVEFVRA